MKTIIRLFFMLAVMAGLYSCELLDVDVDTKFNADLNLTSVGAQMKSALDTYSFGGSTPVDPNSNKEVEKYADKIKDYTVKSITVEVTATSDTTAVIMQGSHFIISDLEDDVTWTLAGDFKLKMGNKYTLSNKTGDYAGVQAILRKNKPFTISGTGFMNKPSVFITLDSEIDVTIKANPL